MKYIWMFKFILLSIVFINLLFSFWFTKDLVEKAFEPAFQHETILDLGKWKNAVGNEVLREWVGVNENLGIGCLVQWKHLSKKDLEKQMKNVWYNLNEGSYQYFCQTILWWDWDTQVFTKEPPLIVRITKFLLRMTIALSVTMIILNSILWIIESAKGGDVKDAKKNIILIIVGILISLLSLVIIQLINSLTISSLQ